MAALVLLPLHPGKRFRRLKRARQRRRRRGQKQRQEPVGSATGPALPALWVTPLWHYACARPSRLDWQLRQQRTQRCWSGSVAGQLAEPPPAARARRTGQTGQTGRRGREFADSDAGIFGGASGPCSCLPTPGCGARSGTERVTVVGRVRVQGFGPSGACTQWLHRRQAPAQPVLAGLCHGPGQAACAGPPGRAVPDAGKKHRAGRECRAA